MTISKTFSAIPFGFTATPVTIECDSTRGLSMLNIVGMGNKTIEESRERIRSAIRNAGFSYPTERKITVNLAPAGLPKTGSYLDLAIAVAILTHFQQLPRQALADTLFVGELALDGKIRPIRGILNIIKEAERHHFKRLVIPSANSYQASLISPTNAKIIPIDSLHQFWRIAMDLEPIPTLPKHVVKNTEKDTNAPLFDQIVGQTQAKRALTIAVAGRHNIILSGPPGTGKSLLASTIPNLLPPPNRAEIAELTQISSLHTDNAEPCTHRPFRAPHHSASRTALIGGADGLPGEIALAHLGVLYLDELPEFRRDLLEALRQPLENRRVTLSLARHKISYPADFMLVATMNPCPCGYLGSDDHICTCNPGTIMNYRRKLSGPLLDRIDLQIKVPRVDTSVLVKNTTIGTVEHETAKSLVQKATNTQFNRCGKYNSSLSSAETVKYCPLDAGTRAFLDSAAKQLSLSARSYFKILKVARTIADLEGSENIAKNHLAEALQFRQEI